MKKLYLTGAMAALIFASSTLTSCIGSFALTKDVMAWNNQIGSKFINEVVFFAFWVVPVYEFTSLADALILNSVEFWSGKNPMEASVRTVNTDHGRYTIACDGKGYDITNEQTGENVRLAFTEETQTWSVETAEGAEIPFMTMLDDTHVRMILPNGATDVELSAQGVETFRADIGGSVNDPLTPVMAAN